MPIKTPPNPVQDPAVRAAARKNLKIPSGNRVIVSVDGGGMRGILSLQLLKKIEEIAGAPVHAWADMVAGTSTGAIIAGLMATGRTAAEIEQCYKDLVGKVFTKRDFLANRFLNPPAFDKKNYRALVKGLVGDVTLRQACAKTGLDLLITSRDMTAGEETFFTCFGRNGGFAGTYKDVLLRAVMEATMSAPTYFLPFERFIDGGTTTFNNPVAAAVMEALCYDGTGKYAEGRLTVFSFGTGTTQRFVAPEDTANPKGADVAFWLSYLMDETGKDASAMQMDILRSGLVKKMDMRRYQISFDTQAVGQLPDNSLAGVPGAPAGSLHGLGDKDLGAIDMADTAKMPLVAAIGQGVTDYICPPKEQNLSPAKRKGNWFRRDLNDPETDRSPLVTAHGDIDAIARNLADPAWVDGRKTG
jgi:hypothetical protein